MHPSSRLVRSNRPEGCKLSCLDPPSTQAVSPLCIRRASISVQGPPLRAVPVTSCLHQGHGGSPCSNEGKRYSHSQLTQRLAHTGPVSRAVMRTQGHSAQSPQPVGASGQLGKEQTLPCAEDLFSWYGVVLGQPHSTSLNRTCSIGAELPGVFPAQEGGSTETISEAPGAYGIRSRCYAAQVASYETASVLASRPGPVMGIATLHLPGPRHPVLPPNLQPVVGPCLSSGRSSPSASVQACCCINRCLCHGLGSHVQWACSIGALDRADEEQVPLVAPYWPKGLGSQNWCSSRQPLLGKFLWGGISFLREGAPFGTHVQTCGIFTCGPWTGRGGSKWATSSGSGHHHFS